MKKLFIVLAVASLGFVACNNEGETKETTVDSAAIKDSIAKAQAAAEAAAKDTMNKMASDTSTKK